jgi:hypothetical protein
MKFVKKYFNFYDAFSMLRTKGVLFRKAVVCAGMV